MRSLQVVILAAGGGSRMKSQVPKVLHQICGRPMVAYALDLATATGVKQPIVILGEAADEIRPHLPKEVKVVIQKAPQGTGDAVLTVKRALGGFSGDLLILYADTPLLRRTTVQKLVEAHYKSNAACTLLTTHLADPYGYGRVVRDPTGNVISVVEEAEANAAQRSIREINVGPICAKAEPLFEVLANGRPSSVKKEWYLTQAVHLLAQREGGAKFQTVRLEEVTEAHGVNSRADLARAAGIIRQRIIDSHLNNGVTVVDPDHTYIDQGVTIGQDTTIHPGSVIESGAVIGKRCSIGPYARLRGGVVVSDDVRIGNFAELVRTKLGAGVRMNHVSYLGDTTVEDEVNIGAGTITANFDGTSKLPTIIGKGAFIGCDTVLIAPVKVGPGAVTGAGSVIPKGHDVPPREVVVGVPAHSFGKAPAKSAAGEHGTDGGQAAAKARQPVERQDHHAAGKAQGNHRPVKGASKPLIRRAAKVSPKRRVRVAVASRRRPVAAGRKRVSRGK